MRSSDEGPTSVVKRVSFENSFCRRIKNCHSRECPRDVEPHGIAGSLSPL
jgi:hypothetical protein